MAHFIKSLWWLYQRWIWGNGLGRGDTWSGVVAIVMRNILAFKWAVDDCHGHTQGCWEKGEPILARRSLLPFEACWLKEKNTLTLIFEQHYQSVRYSSIRKGHRSYKQQPSIKKESSTKLRKGACQHRSNGWVSLLQRSLHCEFLCFYVNVIQSGRIFELTKGRPWWEMAFSKFCVTRNHPLIFS